MEGHRMQSWLLVFVGGGLGAALRHGVNIASVRLLGPGFPWGTLTVNIAGSLAMGLLAAWFARRGASSEPWRLFLATGVLGGFTTFSAFSLDAALLIERQQLAAAGGYVAASVLGSVGALFLGLWLTRAAIA
jgi:fluoride exporter